jgi:hypothetical protein
MAKKPSSSKESNAKVKFGKRRIGKHSKTLNKHSSPSSKYKGQGR